MKDSSFMSGTFVLCLDIKATPQKFEIYAF